MYLRLLCLLSVIMMVAIPITSAQFGTRPDDMHIDQSGFPNPGSTVNLTFRVTNAPGPGLGYQLAMSQGHRGIPVPGGVIPLVADTFFFLSATNALPGIFNGFSGILDPFGKATGSIVIPNIPQLDGFSLNMAFVIYDSKGIQGISRAHEFQVLAGGQTAICGNTPANNFEVVDLVNKAIVTAVPTGNFTQAPYYDLSCKNIVATNWAGMLHQVDVATNSIVNSIQTSGNSCVGGAAVMTSNGERWFVCNANALTPSIVEFDPATFTEVKNHTFPPSQGQPAGMAPRPFSPDALITCFLATGALYGFDMEAGTITTIVGYNTINNPQDAVWRPQGDLVFVCEYGSTYVWAFDASYKLIKKINAGVSAGPCGIAMSQDGTYFYTDNFGDRNIAKVDCDPTSIGFGTILKNIPLPAAFSPGGWMSRNYDFSKVYVLLTTGLGEIDTVTDTFNTVHVPTSTGAAIFNVRHHQQDL